MASTNHNREGNRNQNLTRRVNRLEMKTRRCSKCGEEKPRSEFHKNQWLCKICHKEYYLKSLEKCGKCEAPITKVNKHGLCRQCFAQTRRNVYNDI